jgi:predicted metal-dependent hydrolase
MPAKYVEVPEVGQVALYKRAGVRAVRLSITHEGIVRVTLPTWAPYRLGIEFAKNKAEWISKKRKPRRSIESGDRVGKAHRFVIQTKPGLIKPTSRLKGTDIIISIPTTSKAADAVVQAAAERTAIKALKKEGEQLLPQRLNTLSRHHGLPYTSVGIKRLRSRWGSCNERKEIVLNCYLMQLPWHLIDYVLLHELVHTKVLRHGEPFWSELGKHVKNLKEIRKEMKLYQPMLTTQEANIVERSGSTTQEVIVETA